MEDGWVMDEDSNLLVWVPDEYHNSLWWPKTRAIIGGRLPRLTINFDGTWHGADWTKIMLSNNRHLEHASVCDS
jgi:hypothetical protein